MTPANPQSPDKPDAAKASADLQTNVDVQGRVLGDMEINTDRSRRIRSSITFWLFALAVGAALAVLLMQFTKSKLLAVCFAGGMLLYMLIYGAITGRNLKQSGDDGRLD